MYSFPNLEPVCCSMPSSNCCFLTWIQIFQEAGQVLWYSHLFQNFPQFIVIHTVKGFGIVNKADIDVFLEFSCFFNDPANVGNFISGSSVFSICVCVCVCVYVFAHAHTCVCGYISHFLYLFIHWWILGLFPHLGYCESCYKDHEDEDNPQNSLSWVSTACELRAYTCTDWTWKRQKKQKLNCQHTLDYR